MGIGRGFSRRNRGGGLISFPFTSSIIEVGSRRKICTLLSLDGYIARTQLDSAWGFPFHQLLAFFLPPFFLSFFSFPIPPPPHLLPARERVQGKGHEMCYTLSPVFLGSRLRFSLLLLGYHGMERYRWISFTFCFWW